MKATQHPGGAAFRVWIARCQDSAGGHDTQPTAVALEPAEPGTMGWDEAATYVEAFNQAARCRPGGLRAVALPVGIRYEGDPLPGQTIRLRPE